MNLDFDRIDQVFNNTEKKVSLFEMGWGWGVEHLHGEQGRARPPHLISLVSWFDFLGLPVSIKSCLGSITRGLVAGEESEASDFFCRLNVGSDLGWGVDR